MNAAASYYDAQEIGLGLDFLDEIHFAFNKIKKFPERWALVGKKERKYIVKRFPYNIIYQIDPNEVIILAIAHQKRKWGYWKSRVIK